MEGASGAVLTANAFGAAIPAGHLVVSLGTVLFAYSTLLGWSYYGERSAEFIFGERVIMPYRILWVIVIVIGASAYFNLGDIINFADTRNGLMAVPNLIALLARSAVIFAATKEAQAKRKQK
jgi:AGCS family alanine or glycine:cation symporter